MGCCQANYPANLPLKQTEGTLTMNMEKYLVSVRGGIHKGNSVQHDKESLRLNYKVEKLLGEGSYGRVYLVKDLRNGQPRAMKEFPKEQLDAQQTRDIGTEIQILKGLVNATQDHPHIMKIFGLLETSSSYCVISEVLDGGELFDKIVNEQSLSESTAATYFKDILLALSYMHMSGIVHRDLKPENILFDSEGPEATLKLIDFGVSATVNLNESLHGVIGTVLFS